MERQATRGEVTERDEVQVAWEAFRFYAGTNDRSLFRDAYIGSWATKAAFGEHLLSQYDVDRHLRNLPTWLQNYVTVDPVKFVTDFEEAGHYHVAETRDQVYVFDAYVREPR